MSFKGHPTYRTHSIIDASRARDGRYLLITNKRMIYSRNSLLELRELATTYSTNSYTLYDRVLGCIIPNGEVTQTIKI